MMMHHAHDDHGHGHHGHHTPHESPLVMLIPLAVLSIGALFAGIAFSGHFIGHAYEEFWKGSLFTGENNHILHEMHEAPFIAQYGATITMVLGFVIWMVFEALFVLSLAVLHSESLALITYFCRGFGYPLFAFSFLVWVNAVTDVERNGAAVGWFYVMFTGGLPTLGKG